MCVQDDQPTSSLLKVDTTNTFKLLMEKTSGFSQQWPSIPYTFPMSYIYPL